MPRPFTMTHLLKLKLVSETAGIRIAQALAFLASLGTMVLGGHKLAELELTESQLLLGVGVLFTLSLQCAILVMLLDLKSKRV